MAVDKIYWVCYINRGIKEVCYTYPTYAEAYKSYSDLRNQGAENLVLIEPRNEPKRPKKIRRVKS